MSEEEAKNMLDYMKSKFFRFLVATKTTTQSMSLPAYTFVPLQDFSKPWTDAELYAKYGLTDDEIQFIESMIKPME
jgi:site-specific DNA-methyltransferase (adenine-specific)